jgi:hypothetical protein
MFDIYRLKAELQTISFGGSLETQVRFDRPFGFGYS